MKILLVQLNNNMVWNAAWKQGWRRLFSLFQRKVAQLGLRVEKYQMCCGSSEEVIAYSRGSFWAYGLFWMLISKWNLKVSCHCEAKARNLFTQTLKNWNYSFSYSWVSDLINLLNKDESWFSLGTACFLICLKRLLSTELLVFLSFSLCVCSHQAGKRTSLGAQYWNS